MEDWELYMNFLKIKKVESPVLNNEQVFQPFLCVFLPLWETIDPSFRKPFLYVSTPSGETLLKSRYPRNLMPQDQQMNIVGSFIGHY